MWAENWEVDLYAAAEALGIKNKSTSNIKSVEKDYQKYLNRNSDIERKDENNSHRVLNVQKISVNNRVQLSKELTWKGLNRKYIQLQNMITQFNKMRSPSAAKDRLQTEINSFRERLKWNHTIQKSVVKKESSSNNLSQAERQLKQLQKQLLNAKWSQITYFKNAIKNLQSKTPWLNVKGKPDLKWQTLVKNYYSKPINNNKETNNWRNSLDKIKDYEIRTVLKRITKLPRKIKSHIKTASSHYQISLDEMVAIIWTESSGGLKMFDKKWNFNKNKVIHSKVWAKGLTQVMWATLRNIKKRDHIVRWTRGLKQNIMAWGSYYKEMLDRYKGNKTLAIAAYNAWPWAVDKHKGVPPYKETRRQVRVFNKYLTALKKIDIARDILV